MLTPRIPQRRSGNQATSIQSRNLVRYRLNRVVAEWRGSPGASSDIPADKIGSVDAALLEAFGLDPDVLHLNHGAFGVAPVVVRRAAAAWRERAERNPHRFNRVEIGGLVAAARERAAGLADWPGPSRQTDRSDRSGARVQPADRSRLVPAHADRSHDRSDRPQEVVCPDID